MAPKGKSQHSANFGYDHGKAVLCSNIHQRGNMEHRRDDVKEPTDHTEFEVQAYVWNRLRSLGVNARGEVKTKYKGKAYVRFDIAVFDGGFLSHIIEIKRSAIKHKTSWEDTRQGQRYNDFGVPVTIIYGMEDAIRFVDNY
jgi:hypothetical protein